MDARHSPARSHPEAAQHGRAAAGAVQGVGAEVEVEAVTLPAAGPSAEVLGGFEHGDRLPGPGQGGGRGQPGSLPPMTTVGVASIAPRRSRRPPCDVTGRSCDQLEVGAQHAVDLDCSTIARCRGSPDARSPRRRRARRTPRPPAMPTRDRVGSSAAAAAGPRYRLAGKLAAMAREAAAEVRRAGGGNRVRTENVSKAACPASPRRRSPRASRTVAWCS